MQLSRSLFAVVVLGSLLSVPAKANVDYKLVVAGAAGALVAFLNARQVDETKKDALSTVLNAGSKPTKAVVGFLKKHTGSGVAGLATAFGLYHHKDILNTNLVKAVVHYASQAQAAVK